MDNLLSSEQYNIIMDDILSWKSGCTNTTCINFKGLRGHHNEYMSFEIHPIDIKILYNMSTISFVFDKSDMAKYYVFDEASTDKINDEKDIIKRACVDYFNSILTKTNSRLSVNLNISYEFVEYMTPRKQLIYGINNTYMLARTYHHRTPWFINYFKNIALEQNDMEMVEWLELCEKYTGDPRSDLLYDWLNYEDKLRPPNIKNNNIFYNKECFYKIDKDIKTIKDFDDIILDYNKEIKYENFCDNGGQYSGTDCDSDDLIIFKNYYELGIQYH